MLHYRDSQLVSEEDRSGRCLLEQGWRKKIGRSLKCQELNNIVIQLLTKTRGTDIKQIKVHFILNIILKRICLHHHHHQYCLCHPALGYRPSTNYVFHSNLSLESILNGFQSLSLLWHHCLWLFQGLSWSSTGSCSMRVSGFFLAILISVFLSVCPIHPDLLHPLFPKADTVFFPILPHFWFSPSIPSDPQQSPVSLFDECLQSLYAHAVAKSLFCNLDENRLVNFY